MDDFGYAGDAAAIDAAQTKNGAVSGFGQPRG
jgi:hypothetical protein